MDDVVIITQRIKLIKLKFIFIGQGEAIQKGLCDLLKKRKYKIYWSYKKFSRKILDEIAHELNSKYKHFDKISSELSDYILSFQNQNCC